jgi:hypothetical protein
MGRGIGYIDVHLLVSDVLSGWHGCGAATVASAGVAAELDLAHTLPS